MAELAASALASQAPSSALAAPQTATDAQRPGPQNMMQSQKSSEINTEEQVCSLSQQSLHLRQSLCKKCFAHLFAADCMMSTQQQ